MNESEGLPLDLTGIRKRLANLTEGCDFCSPMGIMERLAEHVDDFGGAANQVERC